ncbi:GyrI-like domain-containing protein [Sinomicrobium sp. FJxs]|uniref:GyrI-like domain-containing protein n=2 Tax=Sinomicrobium weinanense TaxID=2842200 RepID=A0A926Q2Q3_9FLAO|nr:GyrI-like domain-containing protein [Sinomicrobium weinanense]MBC9795176.1 GyrI-like domain-containing protein [Sinomicrobium weinanense]
MTKKTLAITASLCLPLILWYLFIKPYDYLMTFTAKTSPGTIYTGIREWGNTENIITLENHHFSAITQQLKAGDSTLTFNWEMTSRNDSVTKVKVRVTDPEHSLRNKIAVLFTRSAIENISVNRVANFKKGLEEHLKTFRVKVNGISEIPKAFCACTTVRTRQPEKAQGMRQHYSTATDFLTTNGIRQKGVPRLEVNDWDIEDRIIRFNFCFPIQKSDSLPEGPGIFYKEIPSRKAIKATFHGDYSISDRAWFALLDYARRNHLNISAKPLEIFYSNPNTGTNPLGWKAEVFMPIDEN